MIELPGFSIDACAVTNEGFARFVRATGYRTQAEEFAWSYVFAGFVRRPARGSVRGALPGTPWWLVVEGASWRCPEGPGSDVGRRQHHPVVHVSHADALAYCAWAGTRLPTEAEWELAARGGLEGCAYPWGDELTPGGVHRCNIWQGTFPTHNTGADGYLGTAPVRSYRPNGYGLYNVSGNVWEWCADAVGAERALRGGSYLCHASYCDRYRIAARNSSPPDSSAGNVGFRCAGG